MSSLVRSSLLVVTGLIVGSALSFAGLSLASTTPPTVKHGHAYFVSIDEIKQNFIFANKFSGSYSHTVTMSDGSTREVTLRPVLKDGHELVELTDKSSKGSSQTFMGPNGTTTNGKLMVSVYDITQLKADIGIH